MNIHQHYGESGLQSITFWPVLITIARDLSSFKEEQQKNKSLKLLCLKSPYFSFALCNTQNIFAKMYKKSKRQMDYWKTQK